MLTCKLFIKTIVTSLAPVGYRKPRANLFSVDLAFCYFTCFSKIVLVAVQDEGSRYASSAVSALRRLGAKGPVLGSFRSSFAFAGYAGRGRQAWIIQQWKQKYLGPSEITSKIPLSSSMSSQESLMYLMSMLLPNK